MYYMGDKMILVLNINGDWVIIGKVYVIFFYGLIIFLWVNMGLNGIG